MGIRKNMQKKIFYAFCFRNYSRSVEVFTHHWEKMSKLPAKNIRHSTGSKIDIVGI